MTFEQNLKGSKTFKHNQCFSQIRNLMQQHTGKVLNDVELFKEIEKLRKSVESKKPRTTPLKTQAKKDGTKTTKTTKINQVATVLGVLAKKVHLK